MSLLMPSKSSAVALSCDPSLPYDILTDYDSYSEWIPFLSQSKLLAREGDLAVAKVELARHRQDKFAVECIHTRNKLVLIRTISGKIPIAQLEWKIEASGEGCKVALTLEAKAFWHRLIPANRKLINPSILLAALRAQVSTFSPDISLQSESGEKILELTETEQGIVCWLRGKKYILTPAAEEAND